MSAIVRCICVLIFTTVRLESKSPFAIAMMTMKLMLMSPMLWQQDCYDKGVDVDAGVMTASLAQIPQNEPWHRCKKASSGSWAENKWDSSHIIIIHKWTVHENQKDWKISLELCPSLMKGREYAAKVYFQIFLQGEESSIMRLSPVHNPPVAIWQVLNLLPLKHPALTIAQMYNVVCYNPPPTIWLQHLFFFPQPA